MDEYNFDYGHSNTSFYYTENNLEDYLNDRSQTCTDRSLYMAIPEIIITFFGLIFNGIALFVIIRMKDYKKIISHWYVLHLSIADILLLLYLPFQAYQDYKGYWALAECFCRISQGLFMMSYYAGILLLTVMSFDRYVAIVHPVSATWRRLRTHENAIIVTIVVWLLSFLLSIPVWVFSKVGACSCGQSFNENLSNESIPESFYQEMYAEEDNNNSSYTDVSTYPNVNSVDHVFCHHRESTIFYTWIIVNFALTFVIPFSIMGICYSLILWRVLHPAINSVHSSNKRKRKISDSSCKKENFMKSSVRSSVSSSTSSSHSYRLTRKQKVTLVVVSLVACFLTCWSPFHFVHLIRLNGISTLAPEGCKILTQFTFLLAYCNSMLNPVFYTFLGSDFRQRLKKSMQFRNKSRWSSGISKGYRSARTSAPSCRRSFGSLSQQKPTEGSSNYPMQTIHSIVSKHYSQEFNERAQFLPSRYKDCSSKYDAETLQFSDVSDARLIH